MERLILEYAVINRINLKQWFFMLFFLFVWTMSILDSIIYWPRQCNLRKGFGERWTWNLHVEFNGESKALLTLIYD